MVFIYHFHPNRYLIVSIFIRLDKEGVDKFKGITQKVLIGYFMTDHTGFLCKKRVDDAVYV